MGNFSQRNISNNYQMQFPVVKESLNLRTTTKRAPCNRTLLEIRCLPLSKKSPKFRLKVKLNSKGAYHLFQQTDWDDRWTMARVFPKSASQTNQMTLVICNSVSRNCCRFIREWNANSKAIFFRSVPNRKRVLHLEVVYIFQTDFPKKICSIWLSTVISGFFC